MSEREQLKSAWKARLQKAVQLDDWGQLIEAQEEYQKLAVAIGHSYGTGVLQSFEKDIAHRIVLCLSARVQSIQELSDKVITPQDIKLLDRAVDQVFSGQAPAFSETWSFPIPGFKYHDVTPIMGHDGEIFCEETHEGTDFQHTHAALSNVNGTVVSLKILRMGLKDAETYIDPFLTVIAASASGTIMDQHDVPTQPMERTVNHVIFNHTIYLRISLEDMQRSQCSLFFEFKHYKAKKKKVSTRCWSFMELAELKPDIESVLEIYHKPTDLRKKKLNLHSVKQLYFHVTPTFIR